MKASFSSIIPILPLCGLFQLHLVQPHWPNFIRRVTDLVIGYAKLIFYSTAALEVFKHILCVLSFFLPVLHS